MGERQEFETALSAVLARIAPGSMAGLARLSGGANMESWSIDWLGHGGETQGFILRRSPSPEWSAGRPFGLATEAALVQAARAGGVLAPEVMAVLQGAAIQGRGGSVSATAPKPAAPVAAGGRGAGGEGRQQDKRQQQRAKDHKCVVAGLCFLASLLVCRTTHSRASFLTYLRTDLYSP